MEFKVIYPPLPPVMTNNLNSGAELLHPEFWSRAALRWSRAMSNTLLLYVFRASKDVRGERKIYTGLSRMSLLSVISDLRY
jgi:hypothetical protein